MLRQKLCLGSFLIAVALAPTPAAADDWPQWRGPQRDGVWREKGIVKELPEGQIPILWRAEIGPGYSGPTVADGRVFITDRLTEPQETERVHAFDVATGDKLWTYEYPCEYGGVGYDAGPRAAVTIDGDRAYALGATGRLFCLAVETGQPLWQKDLNADYSIDMPAWGIAGSPLIDGDLVIVQAGGDKACMVAFDKSTGDEAWKALDDRASYSSPIIVEQAGERVLVCWTGDSVAGLDPQSGTVHWRQPFAPSRMPIGIATPVTDGARVFVSSFYDGSLMLRLQSDKLQVEQIWKLAGPDERNTRSLHAMIGTPLLDGDYVYGVDSYGELRCLNADTGARIWEDLTATPTNRWSTIHMVRHEDRIVMFNERGQLIFAKLSPQGYEELDRAQLIEPTLVQLGERRRGGVCWSHPAFAGKCVFARNDRELVCASLAEE